MKNQVIAAFEQKYGQATRSTKKLFAWNITSGFGVAVQVDQPTSQEYALVWLPYGNPEELNGVVQIDSYSEDQGRHSNTYASPGLEKGKAAFRVKVNNQTELNALMDYLSL